MRLSVSLKLTAAHHGTWRFSQVLNQSVSSYKSKVQRIDWDIHWGYDGQHPADSSPKIQPGRYGAFCLGGGSHDSRFSSRSVLPFGV